MPNKTLLEIGEALVAAAQEADGDVTKAPSSFSNYTPLHGPGGIFAGPGLERDVITAHVRPYGISGNLPMIPSVDVDPRFASLTGYTAEVGSQPAYACDDAPIRYVKGCNLTARFGRVRFDTNTIDIDDVMLRINRGDFTDLILRGQVLGLENVAPAELDQNGILNIVTKSEMVGVGVAFERELNRQIWQGSFAVANEFPGLDAQIATGQKDADTDVLCPALDSDVKNYNYNMLSASIVTYLSTLEWYLKHNAMTMGLDPVQWVIVMRPELWFELTAMWPCAYHTTKCSPQVDTSSTVYIDGRENTQERDAMRNGMYIDINGSRYPVVVDTGIFEHNNVNNGNLGLGQYASTIYMVPLTITGGFPVTYREHVQFQGASADVALLRGLEDFFWTDGGRYSWAIENRRWCFTLAAKTEQRVILRTPQLAGRIDAVGYEPLQHLRAPQPESPYFADGGVSLRAGLGAPNAVWN
jgi:hypothetical protein